MQSIAEDDLGEPLLVYKNKKAENVVMDGNRRLSVLKVLSDEKYAPNDSIAQYASSLKIKYGYKEKKVQVQYSDDKRLIAKTVFERHSGGKNGTSRIAWNAYAAARFGFDEKMGSDRDWRIMALLSLVENNHKAAARFINTNNFSYDIFRRIIRAALKKNIISQNIFTERGERIKKTARKDLVKDAISKTTKFLKAMKEKRLTLSRKDDGLYADEKNIDIYLSDFGLSPDNQELEDAKSDDTDEGNEEHSNGESGDDESTDEESTDEEGDNDKSTDEQNTDEDSDDGGGDNAGSRDVGIEKSSEVETLLRELNDAKLKSLYRSLCTISLRTHPVLAYVGAWSFWEVMARKIGSGKTAFPAFFSSKAKAFGFNEDSKSDFNALMTIISKYGNLSKHSKDVSPSTAANLKNEFKNLEPVLIVALKEAIKIKSK